MRISKTNKTCDPFLIRNIILLKFQTRAQPKYVGSIKGLRKGKRNIITLKKTKLNYTVHKICNPTKGSSFPKIQRFNKGIHLI